MTKNQFEQLQPGQIIQHKKNNEWAFIVHQNFGERVTAVRTIEIRDPENWEVATQVKVVQEEQISIEQAADELHKEFGDVMVGMADKELIVYFHKKKYPRKYTMFRGYPVKYQYVGKLKPA